VADSDFVPSREELHDAFMADYKVRFPEKDTTKGSDGWRLGRVISGVLFLIVAKLLFFLQQMLWDRATGEYLQRWADAFDFQPKGPAPSQGINALRVNGTPGEPVAAGLELSHADGTLYQTTSVGAVVGGDGTAVVSLAATSKGSSTNKEAGDTLTFSAPTGTLVAQAVLVADLVNGSDQEEDKDFQPRLKARITDPPQGGAIADYVAWTLEIPGAATAYVWAHRRGLGTIDVAALGKGRGALRLIADLSTIQDSINTQRPGNAADFKVLTLTPQSQDVTILIEEDDKRFGWDWDDLGVGYAITASSSVAKTITVPTIPATMKVGSRLTVEGEEATVTAIAGGGLLTLALSPDVLDDDPPGWFSTIAVPTGDATGLQVRASGDLVMPVRRNLLKLFDGLGPARDTRYAETSWTDKLVIAKLFAAATDTDGVDDAELTVPVANVVPVDHLGMPSSLYDVLSVPFLVPGKIRVWKMP
jgi:uncharacterized phage protein gp47/JayE